MTLVILAAGMGSRYGGMKQIDPIAADGEFIIDFSVYDALRAGFDKVVIVVKKENCEDFRSTVGKRIEPFIKTEYAFQDICDLPSGRKPPEGRVKPWGPGQALLAARELVSDNFAAINADDFYGRDAFMRLASCLSTARTRDGVADGCMVGYQLSGTLTENGSVSRGQCEVSENGELLSIVERTKIYRSGDGAVYEEDGKVFPIGLDTTVSMNCFGFTPDVFTHIGRYFEDFLDEKGDDLRAEFYYPAAVFGMIREGKAKVKVCRTDSRWLGVTYHEDKERVVREIHKLIEVGEYPERLWK